MAFNPQEHLIDLKGKDYLPVAWRIVWFHDDHPVPEGGINTELISANPPIVKATVYINGQSVSSGHASAVAKGNAVWSGRDIEKAETAAIGRALGHAGYGSQFDDDDEGDFLADSPIAKNAPKTTPASAGTHESSKPAVTGQTAPETPKKGDIRDFTFKGFTTKRDSNGKPYYSFETTDSQFGFYAFSRDPFRAVGIADNVSEGWKKIGTKLKFEHTMSCVYASDSNQDGYWLLNPPKVETSSEITF